MTDETSSEKFRKLPPPVKLEDTIATHDPDAPPDGPPGVDPETDFMLRHGSG